MVNGRPVLACRTNVPDGKVIIEPLANYPVVRDLIVDRTLYDQRLRELSLTTSFTHQKNASKPRVRYPSDFESYEKLSNCIECLICDAVCPVLPLSLQDYGGPALFRHDAFLESDKRIVRSGIDYSQTLHLDYCSTCKACSANCPKEIEVFDDAIRALRTKKSFQEHGLSQIQKSYFQIINDVGSLFSPHNVPLTDELPDVIEPEKAKQEVIFFPGCMMNMRLQGAGRSIVRILESLGVKVHLPKDMVCCGGPLLWTGQDEQFEKVFSENIGVFEKTGVSTIIVGCAGCGMTLKKDYTRLIRTRNNNSKFNFYDFTEYLALLKPSYEAVRENKFRVTYHDPCHLRRGQGVWQEPRKLLNAIPDICFVEIKDADRCCGGMLNTVNRKLGEILSARKAETIINAKVDVVTTECPFCKDIISTALKEERQSTPVYTVAELIEELYGVS